MSLLEEPEDTSVGRGRWILFVVPADLGMTNADKLFFFHREVDQARQQLQAGGG